jgi:hypothetical protein
LFETKKEAIMAKAKMYPVIIDRSVTVELKDKPTITYPAGWKGAVNKATLKVIKDMEAGREVDGNADAVADADTTDAEIKAKHDAADAEIKAKHDAADAEIKKKMEAANAEIAKALKDAREKSAEMLDAAKEQSEQMVADAAKASGQAGA